ncbi:zinc protease [Cricetibacter osteomyelitidis]|uniref:Zinc protease n=1 Tax=Cricetibacter osteomyelitidis TaxID=1521931 RepID=A0A4R2TQM9_9PAST|nr:M16 family metallopeptidase [Cricetibacter osteomyelitidis]TCP97322.1 zinc protease [Cricetibacter osteomyelitidis]
MRLFFGLFLAVFSVSAMAEVSQPIQGKLDNGFRYTILPLHKDKGRLEVRIKVDAGSVDQKDHQHGVAHMVEHMVFRATQAFPQGVMDYLHANKWVRAKNYNAVTNAVSTTYMYTPPQGADLDQVLQVASQMLLHANLTQADLDKERKIITEEWRSGQGVGSRMAEMRNNSVRYNSRYTRSPVIGTQQAIEQMPATELQDFYHIWYVPNNMQALIMGDVDEKSAVALLQKYFGNTPNKAVPNRDYIDPQLTNNLRINKLQDPRCGVSQVAYIWRFDESAGKGTGEQSSRNRLIDRLTLAMLTQRVRNQQENLPKDVKALMVRKSELGNHTGILGIFAAVENQAHSLALQQILLEIERVKQYPFTQAELDKQIAPIQEQLDFAKKRNNDRNFDSWMQVMMNTVMLDKPYKTQTELGHFNDPLLKSITLADVQQRLNEWFNAQDRIVQYQPPRDSQIEPITQEMVNQWVKNAQTAKLEAPQQEKEIVPMTLLPLKQQGKIINETQFAEQNVIHWMLSNGDKVVWLKSPLAKDKTYLNAQSSAGFQAKELNNWQSQVASQLIAQNAPLDWRIEQLNLWKKTNKVNLNISQKARILSLSGQSDNEHFADLLRLYVATQRETQVKDGVDEIKNELTKQINLQQENSLELQKIKAISEFRFGKYENDSLPKDKADLDRLTAQDLNRQWQIMTSAPVTYYIVNNLTAEQMQEQIVRNLASIPRQQTLTVEPLLPLAGSAEQQFAFNLEPKDDVDIWWFTPQQWQGKDAVVVSLLQNIASNKLKLALRDNKSGVYSLRFESRLNPETQRIESGLKFTANPENTQILVDEAKKVLATFAKDITEQDVKQAKTVFMESEKNRLESVDTWMNRLILSENKYQTPQYLSEMQHLADNITLENLKTMAEKLSSDNVKVFVTTQKK